LEVSGQTAHPIFDSPAFQTISCACSAKLRLLAKMLRAFDVQRTGSVCMFDLRYALVTVLGKHGVSGEQLDVAVDAVGCVRDESTLAAVAKATRRCRVREFLEGLSPSLALLAAEKAPLAARPHDERDPLAVLCHISSLVHAAILSLQAELLQASVETRQGRVVSTQDLRAALDRLAHSAGLEARALGDLVIAFGAGDAPGIWVEAFVAAAGIAVERACAQIVLDASACLAFGHTRAQPLNVSEPSAGAR